jgi:hypothetical protein
LIRLHGIIYDKNDTKDYINLRNQSVNWIRCFGLQAKERRNWVLSTEIIKINLPVRERWLFAVAVEQVPGCSILIVRKSGKILEGDRKLQNFQFKYLKRNEWEIIYLFNIPSAI